MLVYMEGLVQIDKVFQITREREREKDITKKNISLFGFVRVPLSSQHHYFGKDLKQIL